MRDFLIEQFGIDAADKALPSWNIEWLDDAGRADTSFADPAPKPVTPTPEEEPAVTTQPDPAFAARETELTERESRLAAREAELLHSDNASFAERLVEEGRLLPASKDKVVAILDALPGHAAVSFAEGSEKLTPGAALRAVLEAQPKVVSYGALDLPDDAGGTRPVAFASDGKAVDPERLAIHNKALSWQRAHPGTAYLDAVAAVS